MSNPSWLVLAALLVPVALMVSALWTMRSKALAVTTAAFTAAALAVCVAVLWYGAEPNVPRTLSVSPAAKPPAAAPLPMEADAALPADVYPTETKAAAALAVGIVEILRDPTTGFAAPVTLEIDPSVSDGAAAEVRNALSECAGPAPTTTPAASSAGAGVHVRTEDLSKHIVHPRRSGTIHATLRSGTRELDRSVTFVEKLWLTDFYLSMANGNRLRAESAGFHTSAHEAEADALHQGAAALADDVLAAILTDDPANSAAWSGPDNRRRLVESIRRQMQTQRDLFILDRLAQRFQRPYGDVWQAKLLIDRSETKLHVLAAGAMGADREVAAAATTSRRSLGVRILSMLSMVAVICVVYVFLNAATRGYYAWALRIAAAAGAVAGLLLIA